MTGQERVAYIDSICERIKADMVKAGIEELTSNQMRDRANYRRHIATGILLRGGTVKHDFEPLTEQENGRD